MVFKQLTMAGPLSQLKISCIQKLHIDFKQLTMAGPLSQLNISCIQKLHIDFKQLTMAGPLSQLKISCNQRMHMIFTFLLTGVGLELTSSRGEGPSIILTNFIGLVND